VPAVDQAASLVSRRPSAALLTGPRVSGLADRVVGVGTLSLSLWVERLKRVETSPDVTV
jgi:hypothetical protein